MRILITGATGFIGSHVVRRLVADGHEVYALIRPDSSVWRIEDIINSISVVPYDLFSTQGLDDHLKHIRLDVCIHLAWYIEPGKYLNSLENLRFVSASMQLAALVAGVGCERFVGAGTCFEYDAELGYFSENSHTSPRSLYAASKLGLYLILNQASKVTGMDVAWVRFFYLYGPYEDKRRLVPSVICSLLNNGEARITGGEQIRDFMHVEDVASAVCAVAESNIVGPVNIGSGNPVSVRAIAGEIGAIIGRPELIILGALSQNMSDPRFICADNRLLTGATAWTPRYDLEQGLRNTVGWWERQGQR